MNNILYQNCAKINPNDSNTECSGEIFAQIWYKITFFKWFSLNARKLYFMDNLLYQSCARIKLDD